VTQEQMIAAAIAHRACCGCEQDLPNGKLHGYCVVCGVPWPCDTAKFFLAQPQENIEQAENSVGVAGEQGTANISRDEISADTIENDSPCAYCTQSGRGHCHECAVQTHKYYFRGRKLRPC